MNPVKIVAGGSAGSVGALVAVYVAGRFGLHLTADDGTVIAVAATAVAAFVAHNGLVGIARMVWSGDKQPPSPPAQ
jgi:hypothetical protein